MRVDAAADGVVALTLVDPAGEALPPWEPGAHIDLLGPNGLERQYSLCGDPGDRERWRIAVLRDQEGRGGSAWVHDTLRAGSEVSARGPRNAFPLVADADRYVLVAGGIGITPLLAMVHELNRGGANWTLHYGGRTRRSMAFVDELARHGDRVALRAEDEDGALDLDTALGLPAEGTAVYCCGPEGLIAAVEERAASWPGGTLHVERFKPRAGALDGQNTPFDVVCAASGTTLAIGADESIAEAAEAAGISVVTSCREGTCGTCETEVIEGEPDHRDSFLSEDERAAGATMMICCSRARGTRLVLDL